MINHYGVLNAGHYMSMAKNSETGQWYEFNDSMVRKIVDADESEIVTDAAYVVFYKLRGYEDSVAKTADGKIDYSQIK